MTFQLIENERAHHAVSRLCSVLDVSRQGFWAWKHRPTCQRRLADERLKPQILAAWNDSDQTYGAPRVHAELRETQRLRVGRKRVARLMRQAGIAGVSRRGRRRRLPASGGPAAPPAPDLVRRRFQADQPDQRWLADITSVPARPR